MLRRTRSRKDKVRQQLNERESVFVAHDAGVLETEAPTERTQKTSQLDIRAAVAGAAARNVWTHVMPKAPYGVSFSRAGKHALVHGHGGRVSVLDLHANTSRCEVELGADVAKAAVFLQDETMFAVAQRKFVYVYDGHTGAEVHRLKSHVEPEHLAFLPYHFLLASVGHAGFLKYHDVSTGAPVSEHKTGLGSAHSSTLNPQTAVLHLGHGNGVVTLWSPAAPQPLVKLLAHRGACCAVACASDGALFATAGIDGFVKVWDARTFKLLRQNKVRAVAQTLSLSQRGMLAVGSGNSVEVYKDAASARVFAPYLSHRLAAGSRVCQAAFRPYEDAVLVGHTTGVDSIVVPGCSEPNYDGLEANPYRSNNARKSQTVRSLLDKLPPETVALDGAAFVGALEKDPHALERETKAASAEADAFNSAGKVVKVKKKMRGRSKIGALLKKKAKNVITAETVALRAQHATDKGEKDAADAATAHAKRQAKKRKRGDTTPDDAHEPKGAPKAPESTPLSRLFKKK